jgi:hypothetical protein
MSLLSETVVHVLEASQTVTPKLITPGALSGVVNVAYATFTVSPSPLAIGNYTVNLSVPIPANSFVYQAIMDTTTTFVGAGSSIAMGIGASLNNLTNGGTVGVANWATGAGNPDRYAVNPLYIVPSSAPITQVNVAVTLAQLTAGSVIIRIFYV